MVPNRKEFIQTSPPWNREDRCLNFTGIPLHSTLLNKLIEIHELQITLPIDMLNKIKEELDRRCIGSASAVLESRVMSKFDVNKVKHIYQTNKARRLRFLQIS